MTRPLPRVAVVVLNWKNAEDTIECLKSLATSSEPVDIVVVDNDSRDGSVDEIEKTGLAATVVRNKSNNGYAGGNNAGLEVALSRGYPYICVLNNDTLIERDVFARLIEALHLRPDLSAISPRIVYADSPQSDWFAGGTIDRGLPRHLTIEEARLRAGVIETQTLTGCCILAAASTWRLVGSFDERYFLIFEDSDWSARARRAGVTLLVHHDAVIRHKVSRSFTGRPMSLLSTYFYVRNGLLYHATHQRRYLPLFAARRVGGNLLRAALRRGNPPPSARYTSLALWHFVRRSFGNAPNRAWARAFAAEHRGVSRSRSRLKRTG